MKETLRSIFVYVLIIYLVLNIYNQGISMPADPVYQVLTLLILGFTVLISCPILSFLTVKCKFPTFLLMTLLLLFGIFYLLKLFMIDFYIDSYVFSGLDIGNMSIKSFEVKPLLVIGIASFVSAFLCAIYRELDSN